MSDSEPPDGALPAPPRFPMDEAVWQAVAASLDLSPQQQRIVEQILQDRPDKQIAAELGIAISTLRSHLERVHRRLQTSGRTGLILHVFKTAQGVNECPGCGQQR